MSRLQALFSTRGARIGLIAIGLILLVGAGAFTAPLLLRGPQLLSATPTDGATDANPQAELRLEFDQTVQESSLAGAVHLDPPVEVAVSSAGGVVTIRPQGGLRYGASYRLTIDPSVKNVLGRTLEAPRTIAFTTLPYVGVGPVTPADGAQAIPSLAPVTVEFSAPVISAAQVAAAAADPRLGTALPQPLSFEPPAPGAGQWLSPTRYSFAPTAGWSAATTYTLTLAPQLTGDGRAQLEQPYTWRFQTAATVLANTRPFDGQADVAADGEIEVRLARDVDADSAAKNFTLATADGKPVQGTLRVERASFFFKPAAPLQRGTRYQAKLAPGVHAASGTPINRQALSWRFDVIGDLAVTQAIPPADASEVLTLTNQIAVHFNHPVVALTAPSDQGSLPTPFTVSPPVQGVGRWLDTSTFVLSPTVALNPATEYRVSVAAGLKDQTGGELRQAFGWRFTTITPQVLGSLPAAGESFFGPTGTLTLVFNQPMDLDSLRGAISLRGPNGTSVPGAVAVSTSPVEVPRQTPGDNDSRIATGFTVTFTPAAPLERGGVYTLEVSTAAKTALGSATMPRAYSAGFTAAPLPRLLSSDPANDEKEVTSSQVRLTFSTPMDWDTVEQQLTLEPKATEVYSYTDRNEISLNFDLAPETAYTVTLAADARDAYGVTIGQPTTLHFRTAAYDPSLSLAGSSLVMAYSTYTPARVPLQTINLTSIDYTLYSVSRPQLTELLALTQDSERWQRYTPPTGSKLADGTLTPKGPRNQTVLTLADLGKLEAGAYFFEARAGDSIERQLIVVSPTTLTVKRSANELFVWAVDLATGKPVANLPVQAASLDENGALDKPVELGRTAADGVLQVPFTAATTYNAIYLWSGDGAPFTFSSTGWSDGIDPWSFSLSASQEPAALVGSLSTDRPLYRPGELVHVRGVLRLDNDGRYNLPKPGQQANLTISDPESNTIYSTTVALSAFGTFSTDMPLAAGAATGGYSLSASFADSPSPSNLYGSFGVAEYRKPAFEVTVVPAREDVLQGERIEATVTAHYFTGGVLANAPVHWRLLAAPLYFSAEAAPGYQFENLDDAYASYRWFDNGAYASQDQVAEGEGTTDAQGKFSVSLPGELGTDGHSRALSLDVEVTDVDGQIIAGQGALRLHAGAFYIGLRPDGYVAEVGKPQSVALLTLDPQGQPVGGRTLEVSVFTREWYSVREQGSDGRFYFTSAFTDTLVQTLAPATTDAQGRATVSFVPAKGGSYRLVATGKDDGGRSVKASAYTWAYGGSVFWGVNDSNRIDLIADKGSYNPGDTAKILVTAPYANSSALLTIERGAVLEHRLLTMSGTSQLIEVPITAAHAPNVYVSVVLITPAGAADSATAPATPDLRMGLINLPVSTVQQELSITLTPDKATVGPRDEVTYSVKTADYTGKGVPAELSLALVDKAVLSLADDPNPSLHQIFYEKRPLGVFTSQSLIALADRVTLALLPGSKGGGGGGGAALQGLVRRDFPDTAYWNAAVVTGADGTASVTVALPDSLTTWRMTARGVTQATEVGQTTTDIIATRPLLVRPSLPRFLTVGDAPQLGAVVQNSTSAAIDATVTMEIIGADNQPAPIQLSDAATQTVSVPANGQAVVRWKATTNGAGTATVRLRVSGGGLEDALEQPLPIQRYATPEVAASAGQVFDTTIETLRPPQGITTDGEVKIELLPSLGAGVRSGLTFLETFPYGCTEQTVSAFLPNAVSYRLYKQLGSDDAALKAALEKNLASGLQRLTALQSLDGGWGWWENDTSEPYLSAYVVQGLGEAVKAGYSVDQTMLDRGLTYLKDVFERDAELSRTFPQTTRLNTRAYILFVLSELGQPDRGRTVALFDQRAQLDSYGRAYLLMALKGQNDTDRAAALVADLTGSAIMRPADAHWEETQTDYWTMSSNTRTTALALQALVRADPTSVLVPNAVRYLVGLRDQGHWRTTQETAVTLMALSEYVAQSGELAGDYTYHVTLNDKSLADGSVGRDNLTQPINLIVRLADLAQGADSRLSLQRQAGAGQTGAGRLYYTLRMRGYQDAASVQPLDQGVGVSREYALVDTATLSPTGELTTQARLGEVVQVRLTLTVPEDMPYFMVEDMLPAGLEPLDTSLKTTSAAARDPELSAANGEQPFWWYFNRTEVRDNRVALFATDLPQGTYVYTYLARAVTPGSFQTLPATAMRTYAPEVFGRSAGTLFTVVGP